MSETIDYEHFRVRGISGNTLKTGLGDEHRLVCDGDGILKIRLTDGTNFMPTMDVAARAGFVKVTDGTNIVGIDTNNFNVRIRSGAVEVGVGQLNADNLLATLYALNTRSFCYVFDGTYWDRLFTKFPNIDNINPGWYTGIYANSYLMGFDPTGLNWDRLRAQSLYANLDDTLGCLTVGTVVHGEDLEVGAGNSEPIKVRTEDGTIPAGEKHLEVIGLGHNYNGTAWKRSRSDIGLNLVGTIEAEHFQIHEGAHYFLYDYDTDIDIVTPKYWHVIAPDTTTRIHVWFEIYTEAEAVIEIFENPTTTGNGTGLTELNSDRNSANEAALTTFKDPTVSVDGTLIMTFRNASEKKVGGVATRDQEIILKQAEQYLFKITSDADDNKSVLHIQWYEV